MTAQSPEILICNGEERRLNSKPFAPYLDHLNVRPKFRSAFSGNWSGYMATWEIIDEKLFMISIHGTLENGKKADLNAFFPGEPIVFANWFTGDLKLPQGERIGYVHGGFGGICEEDLILHVEKGKVVGKEIIENEMPKDDGLELPF